MLLDSTPSPARHNDPRSPALMLDRIRHWHPNPPVAMLTICGTAVAYATTSIFVRQLTAAGMSVIAVAFFRFALTSAVMARFVNFSPRARSATRWGLLSGTAIAVGWIVYVNTITDADVAVAGVVQMTYPLFAVVSGWVFFANRPTVRAWLAGALVVCAAAIGLGMGGSAGPGAGLGTLIVMFVSPATFGFSVAILADRLGDLDPFERLGAVSLGASLAMSPLLLRLPVDEVLPQTVGAFGWVLAIGAISALIPMIAYAAAAPVVGTARTVAAGSLELPTMFVIGAVVFGESIQPRHLFAAGVILAAIMISSTSRAPHVIPDDDEPVVESATLPSGLTDDPAEIVPTLTLEF